MESEQMAGRAWGGPLAALLATGVVVAAVGAAIATRRVVATERVVTPVPDEGTETTDRRLGRDPLARTLLTVSAALAGVGLAALAGTIGYEARGPEWIVAFPVLVVAMVMFDARRSRVMATLVAGASGVVAIAALEPLVASVGLWLGSGAVMLAAFAAAFGVAHRSGLAIGGGRLA